jgi:hypothetical protein
MQFVTVFGSYKRVNEQIILLSVYNSLLTDHSETSVRQGAILILFNIVFFFISSPFFLYFCRLPFFEQGGNRKFKT